MSEESVMKQALSPETPARVRAQFRAITLGIGASAFAMACSFGAIDDKGTGIEPVTLPTDPVGAPKPADTATNPNSTPAATGPSTSAAGGQTAAPMTAQAGGYNGDDPFASEIGKEVKGILTQSCAGCHVSPSKNGDIDYMLDAKALIDNQKIVPGNKEDSRIYSRMVGGQMPPAQAAAGVPRPTFSQIDLVGQWIDEMPPLASELCDALPFADIDQQISAMNNDVINFDDQNDAQFTRYITVSYNSNAGGCGRELDRQRFALFKTINSVSTDPVVHQLQPIDANKTIYRVDIRDFGWDRTIDLLGDGSVTFTDGWNAILDGVGAYAVEYTGTQADSLKTATKTNVPFISANAFIQFADQGDLYYSLINGKKSLFDFEKQVLRVDTAADLAANQVMRGGFQNSGVSKQDRVLNRFDSGVGPGTSYWISFDFDGGGGKGAENVANESVFVDPLGFNFAGGEAIFSLPNGLQGYYVAKADGTRLADAPIGVVVDPSQNNGNVVNGASCNSCHNAGMISFQDQVRQYVIDNKVEFDNQTFEDVMADYPDFKTFQAAMDADSKMHTDGLIRAGLPKGLPDPISRVFSDFQLGNLTLNYAAGELNVTPDVLKKNINSLDPSLQAILGKTSDGKDGYVDRNTFTGVYLQSLCILGAVNENQPVGCP
jgi:hypothetical protein